MLNKKVVSNSISNQVYEILRKSVVTLKFEPGLNISEKEIAEKLQVSRTPVREAFVRLAQEELLEIYPQKGSFISLIELEKVEEARFIREHLELATISLACQYADQQQLKALKENLLLQENSVKEKEFNTFFELDEEFHRMLVEISGKKMVWSAIQKLDVHLKRIRVLSLVKKDTLESLVKDHKEILAAVEARNEEEAKQLLQTHLRHVLTEQERLKEEYPHFFS